MRYTSDSLSGDRLNERVSGSDGNGHPLNFLKPHKTPPIVGRRFFILPISFLTAAKLEEGFEKKGKEALIVCHFGKVKSDGMEEKRL
jgi:hypothetical protein